MSVMQLICIIKKCNLSVDFIMFRIPKPKSLQAWTLRTARLRFSQPIPSRYFQTTARHTDYNIYPKLKSRINAAAAAAGGGGGGGRHAILRRHASTTQTFSNVLRPSRKF